MASDPEQRDSPRFECESRITVKDAENGLTRISKMFNYSETGLYFEADFRLEPGTTVFIGLKDSPLSTPPSSNGHHAATIRWRQTLEESFYTYGYGVELVEDGVEKKYTERRDSRRHKRKRCSLPTRYKSNGAIHYGLVENISRGGIFVQTDDLASVGQKLVFEILLETKDKIVKMAGRVVHSDGKGFGVEFAGNGE
jgi:Tfp pilus assembly protein PilZ